MASVSLKKMIDFKLPTGVLGATPINDDQQLLVGCMDGVYVADINSKESKRISQHGSYVSSVASLPKWNSLVSTGYDGFIKWFHAETYEQIREQKIHDFWSWDMAASPDQSMIASVTGQYIAGGYKYEPSPEREPSVKVLSAETGELLHQFEHVPSVQAVAFSPDSQFVAAGNLMGEVRIWDCKTGKQVANWTTDAFTSWGIIKSHCYLGGIFSMMFTPSGNEVILCGMGPMRDPMAGNGRQLWQKWSWRESPKLVDETHKNESGEGLMETLAIHPDGKLFAMGGRLRGGKWNVALFDLLTGQQQTFLKTGYRATEATFTEDGKRLVIVGTQGQPKPNKQGTFDNFGRVEVYDLS